MVEVTVLSVLYGIILNLPAAACGLALNFLFYPKNKPSVAMVVIACLIFFMVTTCLVMGQLSDKIGFFGSIISSIISLVSFQRTMDI